MWKTAITGIVAGFLLMVGLFFVLRSVSSHRKWEKTEAHLVLARVKMQKRLVYHRPYGYRRYSFGNYRMVVQYHPEVEFVYTVGGRAYKGRRFSFPQGKGFGSEAEALSALRKAGVLWKGERSFSARYGRERRIKVYYDARNPLLSAVVIVPQKVWPYGWLFVLGSVFLLGVMWLFFMSERNRLEEWESNLRARIKEGIEQERRM